MKEAFVWILIFLFVLPTFVKADGIPYPPYLPYISEEHQIVLVEQKEDKIITTLDLGIETNPENTFSLLEESVYIDINNPVWLKTFSLPENFGVKYLCINSYDFGYYQEDTPLVKVTINGNVVYLYTQKRGKVSFDEKMIMPIPIPGQTYCTFISNENMSDPKFVDVSEFFESGEYNTIEVRGNKEDRGFSINRIYLQSGENDKKVEIIIPFKGMPESIEIGGRGIDIWGLEDVFADRRIWYGYYGGELMSGRDAPAVAEKALTIEENVRTVISSTEISADASGSFEGKVSDILGTVHASGSQENEYIVIRLDDVSYETYLDYNAYVIEIEIEPYEFKRIVVRWIENVDEKNNFDYYYPLGTGQTWSENIPYTVIYVKIPEKNYIKFSSIEGKEEVTRDDYRYYRWKFVESKPDKDLYLTIKEQTSLEKYFHDAEVWLEGHKIIIAVIGCLLFIGLIITVRSERRGRRF